LNDALDCKYFHIVFTVPEELSQMCLLDSNLFYKTLFESVWNVLQQFGHTKYSVESGAICVLHTWGQNLSLHPHIHCIVLSAGLTLAHQQMCYIQQEYYRADYGHFNGKSMFKK